MPLNKNRLLTLLETVDPELRKDITIVAVGGTALTLLDAKASTVDIDFTFPEDDLEEFERALRQLPKIGFRIDCFSAGTIFDVTLPIDYLKKSKKIKRIGRIKLKALDPIDIVVTKTSRLDRRDLQDIENCIKRFKLKENAIRQRAGEIELAASEESYNANLNRILNKFFH